MQNEKPKQKNMCHKTKRPLHILKMPVMKRGRYMVIDLLEYKEQKTLERKEKQTKIIPIIKIFKPPIYDTDPFYYTEIKKEQK
jgi:hypothetical protein